MTVDRKDSVSSRKRLPSVSRAHRDSNSNYYKCFQNYYHGHQYLKPNPVYMCDVKSTVNHWQLRDLIQVDPITREVFYTKNNRIRSFNLNGRSPHTSSSTHVQLEYVPRCLNHTENGVTVTGGVVTTSAALMSSSVPNLGELEKNLFYKPAKGLFSFYHPETDSSQTFKLGEMINNAVDIKAHSNSQFKSYVCNNDSYLYCVDITNDKVSLETKIKCEENNSLNNVCQNTQRNNLTVTGDSSYIFMVDPRFAGKINSIDSKHDSGFGISYHNDGNIFAAAFQDGTCLLYDIRNTRNDQPLFEVKSTRPGHQSGAFRCCKFSSSSMNDLFVVLEHVGRVHLIDLRSMATPELFNNHQVIVFPFALDQYANYKKDLIGKTSSHGDKSDTSEHEKIEVYGNSEQFLAPLVYDYDYLKDTNPTLFKNYTYQPPPPPPQATKNDYLPPPSFNYPQWSNPGGNGCGYSSVSPTSSARPSLSLEPEQQAPEPDSSNIDYVLGNENNDTSYYYHDAYQQAVNHIHGELELCGVDWLNSELVIGCEDAGVVTWDINERARKSSGCFSYA